MYTYLANIEAHLGELDECDADGKDDVDEVDTVSNGGFSKKSAS